MTDNYTCLMKTTLRPMIAPIARAAAAACATATAKPTDDRVPAPTAPPSADPGMAGRPVQPAANDDDGDPGALASPRAGIRTPSRAGLRQVIGRRLRAARALAGLDQTRAAELLGYETSSQLSQWEQAKRTPPLEQIVAAAETFGMTTDFLLGLSNEPDRDAHMALRAATLRGVREMLATASEATMQLFERRAALIGPDALHVAAIVDAGQALQNAIAVLMRADGFQELRGGASVVRCADDLAAAIVAARRRLDAHREMGDGIQAQLRAAIAGCSS
ncbi:transcriptional regulator with XRE-family HTH domain [Pelomonas aquatica]|uniref:Transcriptional regulator with XRE-family HTH domain n=1 Tax=Pelomonas aquatica TaxID=431058 RepID=A0ABU1Z4E0_9BURK|nr:helix-turn-helix transcriptional regulator [Pelomonas aquatica]MDR7295465.1 transcriptional regulator with XRE-family HTH domain [Pelomonas aquatica]